ncbi:hypothetical protein ACOME3_001053 [Neoechinorhynchus agilis]
MTKKSIVKKAKRCNVKNQKIPMKFADEIGKPLTQSSSINNFLGGKSKEEIRHSTVEQRRQENDTELNQITLNVQSEKAANQVETPSDVSKIKDKDLSYLEHEEDVVDEQVEQLKYWKKEKKIGKKANGQKVSQTRMVKNSRKGGKRGKFCKGDIIDALNDLSLND